MSADRVFQWFMPRENKFFELLNAIARNVARGSDCFAQFREAKTREDFARIADELRHIEHEGDSMAHLLYNELDKTFVTPIDREDLHDLCSALDTMLDLMEECAGFIVNYRLESLSPAMCEMVRIAQAAAAEVAVTVAMLDDSKKYAALQVHLIHVHALENEGDGVFRGALGDLFVNVTDAIELIRQKDILEALEATIDASDDVGDLIRSLVMKHG